MAVENGVLSYNGSMTFRSQPESFHYVFIGRPIKNGWPICFPPLSPGRRGFRWRDWRRCDDEISKTPRHTTRGKDNNGWDDQSVLRHAPERPRRRLQNH